ncbi:urease accessory protein UreF [Brevibacterium yomogidense]|uniref:Urease accessory protein UreF n=1 Tax=Brevibacterium yomogidense TaxID=946573 RepID=A0A1X6WUT2_9MICO|nr:urease accessory protein UreF [Brevibacterium yomogidense]SLM89050.1 Urease accessory protein UreF [Brevibacterium yomogidense]
MPSTATDPAGLLTLIQLSDSALPTGSFSHSFGLESYLERGLVADAEGFAQWLRGYLHQMAFVDALAVRLTAEAARTGDDAGVRRTDHLLHAAAIPRQVRDAGTAMGLRMNRIAQVAFPHATAAARYRDAVEEGACHGHPALVFALVAHDAGLDARTSTTAYLMQLATALTQNAIRAIPLGQDAGQRVLAEARGTIPDIVEVVFTLEEHDLGASAPGLEIAQMQHETQRARMFMS